VSSDEGIGWTLMAAALAIEGHSAHNAVVDDIPTVD